MRPRSTTAAAFALLTLTLVGPATLAAALHSGTWTEVTAAAAGGWSLIEEGGRIHLLLDAEFETRKAPDLKVFLVPRPAGELTGTNLTRDALLVGPLPGVRGRQELALPEGVDLTAYATLAIHCERYSKLWSVSALD